MRYHLQSKPTQEDTHALVLGTGLAGLLAARVLADHFHRVTLVESPAAAHYADWPPSLQAQRLVERWFPGFGAELMTAGAPSVEWTAECPTLLPAGWARRFQSGLISRLSSPALLEKITRQRLLDYSTGRVTFSPEQVTGLQRSGEQISGVVCASGEVLTADVVLNTSKRNLKALPNTRPPDAIEIETSLYTTTAIFQQPEGLERDWRALLVLPDSGAKARGGFLYPIEGRRWVVTLFGLKTPAGDIATFLNDAGVLRSPVIAEALCAATPLTTSLETTDHLILRQQRYERLLSWPPGLLMFADAACDYGPFYRQTNAALAALALAEALDEQRRQQPDGALNGLAARFHARQARLNDLPWRLAETCVDYWLKAHPPGHVLGLPAWYIEQAMIAATRHPAIYQMLLEIAQRATSPMQLFTPSVFFQIVRQQFAPRQRSPITLMPPSFRPPTPRKLVTQEMTAIAKAGK